MPTFIVAEYLKSKKLMSLMDDYTLPKHAIYAVYPERKHLPEKVRVFIEFMSNKLGDKFGYWDK